jgi:hypothetical protein
MRFRDQYGVRTSRWRWALLMFELFLFALILVMPQVNLPDFTFHRGTAPVVAKAKLISPPGPAVVAVLVHAAPALLIGKIEALQSPRLVLTDSRSLLSLFCVLLC